MSKAFFRQLPTIPSYKLPANASCPICIQPYENQTTDSGSFERAICLPCNDSHIFGSECLLEWLRHGKTCPLCRHEFVFLNRDNDETAQDDRDRFFMMFTIQSNQDWEDYWYATFWILHLHGDEAIERKWHQWQQDWIAAAEHWDASSEAHARAALSLSRLTPPKVLADERQVQVTAAAIQTLRFREYRLYLQFQADRAERPELKAPPGFQLTPDQEDALFQELERKEVFKVTERHTAISRREQWNKLRDVGFVWDPDWAVFWRTSHGRWSRYSYWV